MGILTDGSRQSLSPSIRVSVDIPSHPSVHPCTNLPAHLANYIAIYPAIYPSTYPPMHRAIHPSIINPSTEPSLHPSTHPSIPPGQVYWSRVPSPAPPPSLTVVALLDRFIICKANVFLYAGKGTHWYSRSVQR